MKALHREESGGIKSAMRVVQELVTLGMTQEIEFVSVAYNEPIDQSVFELPKELAERASAGKR